MHECDQCAFVASAEDIYISPEILGAITVKPLWVGKFTMPEWSGHANFYAFICRACNGLVVDYPHGYTGFGYLFLSCIGCPAAEKTSPLGLTNLVLTDKNIYKEEGVALPTVMKGIKKLSRIFLLAVFAAVVTYLCWPD